MILKTATLILLLIISTSCSTSPPAADTSLPADPYLEHVTFVPVFKVVDGVKELDYYRLSEADARTLSMNIEKLKAYIDQLKVRIDPEYKPGNDGK